MATKNGEILRTVDAAVTEEPPAGPVHLPAPPPRRW